MNKKNSKILFLTISSLIIAGVTSSIVTSCSSKHSLNNLNNNLFVDKTVNNSYIYDNKFFSTLDDLATYYISMNENIINTSFYLGDVNSSLNSDSSSIDIDLMRPYNPSKVSPAYLDFFNIHQQDYNKAKKSYAYAGSVHLKYFDFNNNLFNSYDEASQSILNSKNATGVLYYDDLKLNNVDKISFNPLSKKDLLKFKIISFRESLERAKGHSNSKFNLKIYDGESDKNYLKLIDNNYIHNIITNAFKVYFSTRYDSLKESKFNVKLTLVDDERYGTGKRRRNDFKFGNLTSWGDSKIYINPKDEDILMFENLTFWDLPKFNMFANRSDFTKYAELFQYRVNTNANYVAEQARVSNFLGKCYFEILYKGLDKGGSCVIWNPDFRILSHGDESDGKNYVSFKIEMEPSSDFKEKFKSNLKSKFDFSNKTLSNRIEELITENIFKKLISRDIYKNFMIEPIEWKGDTDKNEARINVLWELNSKNFVENKLFRDIFDDSYLYKNSSGNSDYWNLNNNDMHLIGLTYLENILDWSQIKETIWKYLFNKNELNFVIEYNNLPIFNFSYQKEFDPNIEWTNYNISYLESKRYIFDIDKLFLDIFEDNISTNENIDLNKNLDFFNSWINVSQTSFMDNNGFNGLNKNENNLFQLNSENHLIFDEKNNKYKEFIRGENNIVPELDGRDLNYKLNSLVITYNTLYEQIKKTGNSNLQIAIKEQFVKPEDIVVLSNDNSYHEPIDLTYREFLSNNKNVVPSLIRDKPMELYKNKTELKNAIENTLNIKPAEVVILYDFYGNVINPGVELSSEESLLITSDAIFDTEDVIIDNILRTKIVPKDPDYVYYKDGEEQYKLIRNKINKIYELNLNNEKYYFASHNGMMNKLKEYLTTISEKVTYEK